MQHLLETLWLWGRSGGRGRVRGQESHTHHTSVVDDTSLIPATPPTVPSPSTSTPVFATEDAQRGLDALRTLVTRHASSASTSSSSSFAQSGNMITSS